MDFNAEEYYKKVYFRYKNVSFNVFRGSNQRDISIIVITMKRIEIINNNKRYSNISNFYSVKNRDK